jgi:hypothetical protein
MCTEASAPRAAGFRVWAVMSQGLGPRVGSPPPKSVDAAYPHPPVHNHSLLNPESNRYASEGYRECPRRRYTPMPTKPAPSRRSVEGAGTVPVSENAALKGP